MVWQLGRRDPQQRLLFQAARFALVARLDPAIATGHFRGVSILGQERVIVKGKETPVGIFSVNPLNPEAATVIVECDPDKVVKLTEK